MYVYRTCSARMCNPCQTECICSYISWCVERSATNLTCWYQGGKLLIYLKFLFYLVSLTWEFSFGFSEHLPEFETHRLFARLKVYPVKCKSKTWSVLFENTDCLPTSIEKHLKCDISLSCKLFPQICHKRFYCLWKTDVKIAAGSVCTHKSEKNLNQN